MEDHSEVSPGENSGATTHRLLGAAGRRMLHRVQQLQAENVYPYQLSLGGAAGPRGLVEGRQMLQLSSYDYLGLIGHPAVTDAAIEAIRVYGTGTGGVRLLTGTTELHRRLEHRIAAFKGYPAALCFSSGYAANMGVIPSLLSAEDLVILDALTHRSIVDACRLAGASIRRFRHNSLESLQDQLRRRNGAGRTLIIVEGVYSMDGDLCALPDLIRLKEEHGAYLMLDESHSFGVLGRTGRGIDEHFDIHPSAVDLWTTSLGKAIPATGGVVMGSREVVRYLQHGASPFVFSAATCPAAVGAALASLEVLDAEPDRPERARRNSDRLRNGLRDLGYNTAASQSPVVPVIFGDELRAARFARRLRAFGILATPILYPAVRRGAARLRLCATAAHTDADIDEALDAFRRLAAVEA